jgi:hypothetical protein
MSFGQLDQLQRAARALGFHGVLDYVTQVPAEAFDLAAVEVRRHCDLAAHLENRRVQSTSTQPRAAALASFRRELGTLGHHLAVDRRRVETAGTTKAKRARFYRIVPDKSLAALLPLVKFSTTNVTVSELAALPELTPEPKTYEPQRDIKRRRIAEK